MSENRIWSRIGNWFSRFEGGQDTAVVDRDERGANGHGIHADREQPVTGPLSRTSDSVTGSVLRLGRRDQAIEKLQDAYERVTNLVDSIHQHMEAQQKRGDEMNESLRILAQHAHTQRDAFDRIEKHVEAQAEQSRHLAELPQIARSQQESASTFSRHVSESRGTQEKLAVSLDTFGQSVSVVSEAATTAADTMRDLHERTAAREERITVMLQEQTRRFTWFAMTAIAVALIATAVGLIAMLQR